MNDSTTDVTETPLTAFEAYLSIPAMNWSSLKSMVVSPRLYEYRTEHERKDTASFHLGRAIHCAVVEPEALEERHPTFPGKVRRGKVWDAWDAEHPCVESITATEREKMLTCAKAVREHAGAFGLLDGARTEQTTLWTDAVTGIKCKARLDALKPTLMADLKSCRGLRYFRSDASKYLYHGQIAWYFDGAVAAKVLPPDAEAYIIAVSTSDEDAFDVRADLLPDEFLDAGRRLYRRLLDEWVECKEANLWPGQFPGIGELRPTHWAAGMEQDESGEWL